MAVAKVAAMVLVILRMPVYLVACLQHKLVQCFYNIFYRFVFEQTDCIFFTHRRRGQGQYGKNILQ
jgi:hypothetical protein